MILPWADEGDINRPNLLQLSVSLVGTISMRSMPGLCTRIPRAIELRFDPRDLVRPLWSKSVLIIRNVSSAELLNCCCRSSFLNH